MTSRNRRRATRVAVMAALLVAAGAASAFQMESLPAGAAEAYAARRGLVEHLLAHFSADAHERITRRSFACADGDCDGDSRAPAAVLDGVLWSDAPPGVPTRGSSRLCKHRTIRLSRDKTTAVCYVGYLIDAAKQAKRHAGRFDESYLNVYRTHYGDLQFLHAMGSARNEAPARTQAAIMAWAEFAWRVSTPNEAERIRPRTRLSATPVSEWFADPRGKGAWSAVELFAMDAAASDATIRDMAFGSLLHLVQDSYSASHVERAASGAVVAFHNYALQHAKCHRRADEAPMTEAWWHSAAGRQVVAVGAELIRLRRAGAPWDEVRDYLLHTVFPLAETPRPSGDGGWTQCRGRDGPAQTLTDSGSAR